jgi:hypothetical protein
MSELARKAAASKIVRAIGHKQAHMMATLIQELRNEEQFTMVWRTSRTA